LTSRIGLLAAFGLVGLVVVVVWMSSMGRMRAPLPATGSGIEPKETVSKDEDGSQAERFQKPIRAMWVWNPRVVLTEASRTELLNFCRSHRIDTLYLFAYDLRPPIDRDYRALLRQAHRAGIAVHALAGDPRWGKSQYHSVALEWLKAVEEFNAQSGKGDRFDGIHTDIEVYLLSKSWKEQPAVLLGGYLDLHAELARRIRESGQPLHLGMDIPFWFDDDPSYRILWQGKVKLPAQHVLDIADSVTVMAYRNFAEGSDGTIHLVSMELDYADRIGKKVVIGQETQEGLYPAYVTFGGTSCELLKSELNKIERAVGHRPSFGGFAFHHYESYRKLCSRES
jgi:hypothetical protein